MTSRMTPLENRPTGMGLAPVQRLSREVPLSGLSYFDSNRKPTTCNPVLNRYPIK